MKELLHQGIKFIGTSGIGWILDFITYTGLGFVSSNVVVNNYISSWVGVTFVFIFATRKIFENKSKIPLKWKYLIYLLYQAVLIYFISILLGFINQTIHSWNIDVLVNYSAVMSKIIVTPITMILNFFVMKGVVEKI